MTFFFSSLFYVTGEGFTGTLREGKEVLVKVQSEDACWVASRLGNIGITGATCHHFLIALLFMLLLYIIDTIRGFIKSRLLASY